MRERGRVGWGVKEQLYLHSWFEGKGKAIVLLALVNTLTEEEGLGGNID